MKAMCGGGTLSSPLGLVPPLTRGSIILVMLHKPRILRVLTPNSFQIVKAAEKEDKGAEAP